MIKDEIKVTFGKSVFALSLMTHWRQHDLDAYYDSLTMTGKGNEMITRILMVMLSSFIIMAVFRTHDAMILRLHIGSNNNWINLLG